MRLMLLAAACGLALTIPAAAQNANPDTSKPVKEKKICRSDNSTGSIMTKRICHTKAEWAEIAKQNESNTERYSSERDRNNSLGSVGGGN